MNAAPQPFDRTPRLTIPNDAVALRKELSPRTAEEELLVQQAIWAAAQLIQLLASPPANPDRTWLRLFTLADRVFHRNLRDLRRLRTRRPSSPEPVPSTPATPPSPVSAPPPAPSSQSASPSPSPSPNPRTRIAPRPTPTRSSSARPAPTRPRPVLDHLLDSADPFALPISISPSLMPG